MNDIKWTKYLTEQYRDVIFDNIEILNDLYSVDESQITLPPRSIFNLYLIGEHIGGGSYGQIYELKNTNKVIKLYDDGVDLPKDIRRYEKVIEQVFLGTAKNIDMHYFEHGQITENLYYCVMPKIIPLTEAPFYGISWIFQKAAQANKFVVMSIGRHSSSYSTFSDYKKGATAALIYNIRTYTFDDKQLYYLLNDFKRYKKTIYKIFKAGYDAYSRHDGEDLHAGNIGYLPQKPDIFFYFDM